MKVFCLALRNLLSEEFVGLVCKVPEHGLSEIFMCLDRGQRVVPDSIHTFFNFQSDCSTSECPLYSFCS